MAGSSSATVSLRAGPKSQVVAEAIDWSLLGKPDYRRFRLFCKTYLSIPKGNGAGMPFKLRPWQVEIARGLMPARGPRPRAGLVSLPRGNGKSTLGAALALYALLSDDIASPTILTVAADLRQASLVFMCARRMIELSPELSAICRVYQDRIVSPLNDGVLMPLPSDPDKLMGQDFSLCLIDELHVVTREVYEAMSSASGKRPESMLLAISTPPSNPESVMFDLVSLGRTDPRQDFFFREWTSDLSHPVDCIHCMTVSNPALGDFLSVDSMASVRRTTRESSFRRLRLGQWVDSFEDSWITSQDWLACQRSDYSIPDRARVVLAFDGSFSGDATAVVAVECGALPHIKKVKVWEPQGRQDFRVPIVDVENAIRQACKRWQVMEIACDPYRWSKSLQALQAEGLPVVEFPQSSARMTPSTVAFSEAVANQGLTHGGDADLTRHVMNARVTEDHRGTRINKVNKNSERKIDLAVCALMGFSRALHYSQAPRKYRTLGLSR